MGRGVVVHRPPDAKLGHVLEGGPALLLGPLDHLAECEVHERGREVIDEGDERLQHLLLRQPRTPGLRHAHLDVLQRAQLVRVGVDSDLHAGLARKARVRVTEVEPVRLRVDLEEGSGLSGLLDDALDVHVGRAANVDLPRREVTDHVDVRVVHGREHPLGGVAIERAVQGGDHPVALDEVLVRQRERAVDADVHLDPLEDSERLQPLVERVDLEVLLRERAARMIGDREVRVASFAGGERHLLERVPTVGPRRMAVEVALDVAEFNERRQLALPRRLQLARVLA